MFSQTGSGRRTDVTPVNFERKRSVTPGAILIYEQEVAERSRHDDVRRTCTIVRSRQVEKSRTNPRSARAGPRTHYHRTIAINAPVIEGERIGRTRSPRRTRKRVPDVPHRSFGLELSKIGQHASQLRI